MQMFERAREKRSALSVHVQFDVDIGRIEMFHFCTSQFVMHLKQGNIADVCGSRPRLSHADGCMYNEGVFFLALDRTNQRPNSNGTTGTTLEGKRTRRARRERISCLSSPPSIHSPISCMLCSTFPNLNHRHLYS